MDQTDDAGGQGPANSVDEFKARASPALAASVTILAVICSGRPPAIFRRKRQSTDRR